MRPALQAAPLLPRVERSAAAQAEGGFVRRIRKRIVLHDYAGHPFQVQLSRELAYRGHEVHHLYFLEDLTPRGALRRKPADPPNLVIEAISIGEPFEKYNYLKRHRQESEYGRNATYYIENVDPDIVICANTPVDALAQIRKSCSRSRALFIVWLQDVLSIGVRNVLRRRFPFAGELIGQRYMAVEKRNLRSADKIVCITENFLPLLERWGIEKQRCEVIENWAPLDELLPFEGPRQWASEHGLEGRRIVLYSGTLGLKHNPRLLSEAARALGSDPLFEDVAIVVVTEGPGAEFLETEKRDTGLDNLVLLPWQPYERLSEMLSSAELLLAVLEPDAGVFAVPSKVLSYLCVGRPVLLAAPAENLASRTLLRAGAGRVVPPDDVKAFVKTIEALLGDRLAAKEMGRRARTYAERSFEIATIADRFEALWDTRDESSADVRPAVAAA
jgi:colanic acid biosynthesis glycosyl transferase WcaI